MYDPLPHRQDDLAAQHALIRDHPLGLLISHGPQGLEANAIPFLVDPAASRLGTLQAHMARANGQWRALREADEALVIFQGADHYITPSWYQTKQETGRVVPTWNYVMVQVRGRPRVIEDAGWLRAQIEALTNRQEGARAAPWAVGDAPEAFIDAQIKAIVGLEVEISDIAGKWKASQNRPAADRAGVIAGLKAIGDEASSAMASIVREAAPKA
jgi:transcriptional regulator